MYSLDEAGNRLYSLKVNALRSVGAVEVELTFDVHTEYRKLRQKAESQSLLILVCWNTIAQGGVSSM